MGAAEGSFPGPFEDSVAFEAEQAENQAHEAEQQAIYRRFEELERRIEKLEKEKR